MRNILIIILFTVFSAVSGTARNKDVKTIVQTGHTSPVTGYAISYDGKYLISRELNAKIIIWDIRSGKQLREITGLEGQWGISRFYFNPIHSTEIFIKGIQSSTPGSGPAEYFTVLDWTTGETQGVIKQTELLPALQEFEDTGFHIHADCSLESFNKARGEKLISYKGNVSLLGGVSVNRNDSLLLVVENNPQVWDLARMEMVARLPLLDMLKTDTAMVFVNNRIPPYKNTPYEIKKYSNPRPNDSYLKYGYKNFFSGYFVGDSILMGGYGRFVTLWDTEGNLIASAESEGYPIFVPQMSGNKIVAATYGGICTGDFGSGYLKADTLLRKTTAYPLANTVKAVSGNNTFIAGFDLGELRASGFSSPGTIRKFNSINIPVMCIDTDEYGENFIVAGEFGTFYRYSLKEGKRYKYKTPTTARISCCAYFSDGIVAAGAGDGLLAFWKVKETEPFLTLKAHDGEITCVAQTHDGKQFITSSKDGTAKIWDAQTYKEIIKLIALEESNEYIAVTPDNYYKASRNSAAAMHFMKGSDIYEFDQFDLQYNRPDIILKRIGRATPETIALYRKAWEKRLRKMKFTPEMLSSDFHTPELAIANREEIPLKTFSSSITLEIQANDDKYKLNRLQIWLNGVPAYGLRGIDISALSSSQIKKTLEIELAAGSNRIDISCLNEKGAESYMQTVNIVCEKTPPVPELYVACLGVSRYEDSQYNLRYADKDARDIAEMFSGLNAGSGLYAKVHTQFLLNGEVTLESVEELKKFFAGARRDDAIVLFYAGHGVIDANLNYYLATSDIDFSNPSARGLPYENLEALLDNVRPIRKLMFIDACHSGEIDKEDYLALNAPADPPRGEVIFRSVGNSVRRSGDVSFSQVNDLVTELFSDLRRGVGATILSSAGAEEAAVESDRWSNGLFTYVVKEGLTDGKADLDGDGIITTYELSVYSQEKVRQLSGGRQKPTSRIDNRQFGFALTNR